MEKSAGNYAILSNEKRYRHQDRDERIFQQEKSVQFFFINFRWKNRNFTFYSIVVKCSLLFILLFFSLDILDPISLFLIMFNKFFSFFLFYLIFPWNRNVHIVDSTNFFLWGFKFRIQYSAISHTFQSCWKFVPCSWFA